MILTLKELKSVAPKTLVLSIHTRVSSITNTHKNKHVVGRRQLRDGNIYARGITLKILLSHMHTDI